MADGAERRYPEISLRFTLDGSATGPEGHLLPAGLRGDRGQVIFSGVGDVRQSLVERCEGETG